MFIVLYKSNGPFKNLKSRRLEGDEEGKGGQVYGDGRRLDLGVEHTMEYTDEVL